MVRDSEELEQIEELHLDERLTHPAKP